MMCHPIKFGCKKISSSVDMLETVIFNHMSPHCDLELEDSKSILHDTQVHDGASPYQVWLLKVQQLRRYWDEHLLEIWTFLVALTLTTKEHCSLFTRQSSLWLGAIKPNLVSKGPAVQKRYQKAILCLHYPSLWPWPWRQQTNIFGRQSGSWWCITIPSLVVKGSALQKTVSG